MRQRQSVEQTAISLNRKTLLNSASLIHLAFEFGLDIQPSVSRMNKANL
jgi:hypothetical protein